jgi:hypothetical protein
MGFLVQSPKLIVSNSKNAPPLFSFLVALFEVVLMVFDYQTGGVISGSVHHAAIENLRTFQWE